MKLGLVTTRVLSQEDCDLDDVSRICNAAYRCQPGTGRSWTHGKNTQKRTFDPKVLDKEAYGFLAQEVQPLFPEAVGTDPDGYLNFDLHPILIASVNALKELNAKNEQLEQKSSQLEKENQSLKESVQAINDKMLLIIAEMEKLKK